mmetsp:Transcript_43559/g.123411  ORF Transcript_43559/g.123411 Transcript_43559/m.123411 type:complete len:114 (-) Transcript_43559:2925-3266(-)
MNLPVSLSDASACERVIDAMDGILSTGRTFCIACADRERQPTMAQNVFVPRGLAASYPAVPPRSIHRSTDQSSRINADGPVCARFHVAQLHLVVTKPELKECVDASFAPVCTP